MTWFPPTEFYDDAKCEQCGACCHTAKGVPCEHLRYRGGNISICEIYEGRLGWHAAVDGTLIRCVPVQREIEEHGGSPGCAYVREILAIREAKHE